MKDGKIHGGTHAATNHMIKLMRGMDRHTKGGHQVDDDYEIQSNIDADAETNFPGRPQMMWSEVVRFF